MSASEGLAPIPQREDHGEGDHTDQLNGNLLGPGQRIVQVVAERQEPTDVLGDSLNGLHVSVLAPHGLVYPPPRAYESDRSTSVPDIGGYSCSSGSALGQTCCGKSPTCHWMAGHHPNFHRHPLHDFGGEVQCVPRRLALTRAAAKAAGIDHANITSHSPRVGMAQDLFAASVDLPGLMQHCRWTSAAMAGHYTRNLPPPTHPRRPIPQNPRPSHRPGRRRLAPLPDEYSVGQR